MLDIVIYEQIYIYIWYYQDCCYLIIEVTKGVSWKGTLCIGMWAKKSYDIWQQNNRKFEAGYLTVKVFGYLDLYAY